MRDLDAIELLTFDCYGTLIDWESGILGVLRPMLRRHGCQVSDTQILEHYARLESAAQSGRFRRYREVLRSVVDGFAAELGFAASADERCSLERSLGDWQPFPDSVAVLELFAERYRLGIFSNVDDDLFQGTAERLGVGLDHLVTAQQVGAYKPAPAFFRHALGQVAAPKEALLHIAQSLHHDIAPAKRMGLSTVWVNRRHGRAGSGATLPSAARADLEVRDLHELAAKLGL